MFEVIRKLIESHDVIVLGTKTRTGMRWEVRSA